MIGGARSTETAFGLGGGSADAPAAARRKIQPVSIRALETNIPGLYHTFLTPVNPDDKFRAMPRNTLQHRNLLWALIRRGLLVLTAAAALVLFSGCEMIFFLSSGGEVLGENLPEHFELIYRQRDLRNAVLNGGIEAPDEYFQGKNVHGAFQAESDTLYITFFGSESPADYFDNMIHLLIDAPFSGDRKSTRLNSSHYS